MAEDWEKDKAQSQIQKFEIENDAPLSFNTTHIIHFFLIFGIFDGIFLLDLALLYSSVLTHFDFTDPSILPTTLYSIKLVVEKGQGIKKIERNELKVMTVTDRDGTSNELVVA